MDRNGGLGRKSRGGKGKRRVRTISHPIFLPYFYLHLFTYIIVTKLLQLGSASDLSPCNFGFRVGRVRSSDSH